ncbi:hypothetical protein [Gemmata palustris]|nr:hypothetical protein [Gemmata palustris]
MRLGERCSSTAFAAANNFATADWINLAGRGSAVAKLFAAAAVP